MVCAPGVLPDDVVPGKGSVGAALAGQPRLCGAVGSAADRRPSTVSSTRPATGGGFVDPCGDGAELLEPVEAAFDDVPGLPLSRDMERS